VRVMAPPSLDEGFFAVSLAGAPSVVFCFFRGGPGGLLGSFGSRGLRGFFSLTIGIPFASSSGSFFLRITFFAGSAGALFFDPVMLVVAHDRSGLLGGVDTGEDELEAGVR